MKSRPLHLRLLDDANFLRQVALQEFDQFSFVMPLKFMTNINRSDGMMNVIRNRAPDLV
jgi:hypothetical protein